jgi:hypothetical protein
VARQVEIAHCFIFFNFKIPYWNRASFREDFFLISRALSRVEFQLINWTRCQYYLPQLSFKIADKLKTKAIAAVAPDSRQLYNNMRIFRYSHHFCLFLYTNVIQTTNEIETHEPSAITK